MHVYCKTSFQLTFESPPGIKRNMQRSFDTWGTSVIEKTPEIPHRVRTLYALAWFHAVCQERRIYIPQGWCKFYEFNSADLKSGFLVFVLFFGTKKSIIIYRIFFCTKYNLFRHCNSMGLYTRTYGECNLWRSR